MPDTPRSAPKDTATDPRSVVGSPGSHEGSRPPAGAPLELSSFVGREREVAEVGGLLAGGTRLLTLTGRHGQDPPCLRGGLRGGRRLRGRGVVGGARLGLRTGSRAAGRGEGPERARGPGRSLREAIADDLGGLEILLVLDNCEHLVGACAELAGALLRSCADLVILATSREPLGVGGERIFPVPPLSSPDSRGVGTPEEVARYEAVRLFVDRAKAVAPSFGLTEANAPAVTTVCRRLDGMPLAIELAAARVRMLSVEQISSRLEDSLALLTGGSRTALPHQRTLRAAINWSYALLSEEEQALLGRLSVFAGGFTLEAAEEVCSGEGIESEEVLDLLTRLADKSLVQVAGQDGEARYRLLETVRQYAREKLEESGEKPDVRRHHAEFFLELAERVEPLINGKDRELWLGRLDAEHDNLRAALAWSREEAEGETALRLSGALSWFWYHREYWSEWRSWLDGALAIREEAGGASRTAARAKALSGGGFLAWMQGDQDTARSQLEESVALWREVEDKQGLAQALRFLSGSFESQGNYAVARPLAEESVELFRQGDDKFGLGITLSRLGITALAQGDDAAARAALEEGVAICREIE